MTLRTRCAFALIFLSWAMSPARATSSGEPDAWESAVRRLLHTLRGADPHRVEVHFRRGRTIVSGELAWADDQTWSLTVRADGRAVTWSRSPTECALELPERSLRFRAHGEGIEGGAYRAFVRTLAASHRDVRQVTQVLFGTPIFAVLPILRRMAAPGDEPHFRAGDIDVRLDVAGDVVRSARVRGSGFELDLTFAGYRPPPPPTSSPAQGWEKSVSVPRAELEGVVTRGLARAAEILDGDAHAEPLVDQDRRSGTGRLIVRNGHRILLLGGDARANGRAHGELLREEIARLMSSTLDVVGLAYTIEKGTWFPREIREAWRRLEPHVPEEHLAELRGIAEGAGLPFDTVCLGNVFPELFHCSGFALSGPATVGGKLLHGRVLDYMTEIGLQRHAVLVIQAAPGRTAFANVGYAGFVGSVSGINEHGISIGEMGGRGEGRWDGMPMACLVRHALERSVTLEDALHLFKTTKRTCEYYYVIADGKTRRGVGVAAWPERIELLAMGTHHAQLPEAIEGAVLLSAGDRYRCLVERVRAAYGAIDEERAMELMRPGVAMRSNLHDVLFVPEDLVVHVAHAPRRGTGPAALEPYQRFDLRDLFARAREVTDRERAGGTSEGR